MRRFLFFFIAFSAIHFLCPAQLSDSLAGTWKTREGDTLLIYKLGASYIIGKPEAGQYRAYKLNASQDKLIAGEIEKGYFLVVGKGKRYLHDVQGIVKRNAYFGRWGSPVGDMRVVTPSQESFFDLSTTAYYAGLRYDLSPRAGILFPCNRDFIRKHHLDSIEVERYGGKKYIDESSIEKNLDYVFYFDQQGNVIKLKVTVVNEPPILWHYTYADVSGGILKSISRPGGVTFYDEDNWEVDAAGQKKIPNPFLHWTYSRDTGLPQKAVARSWNGRPYLTFHYNVARQLVRATYVDTTSPGVVGFHTEFTHDKRGVLMKITEVTEYTGKKY
jgi:hypothetical protein